MSTTTIRPGILVALKSSVEGGVSYERRDLNADGTAPDGSAVEKWETTKVIIDPAEHERASKARSAALTAIRRCCAITTFGLLCPTDNEGALDAAIREARAIVEAHNATATHTHVRVYALKGRIADNDAEAAKAIGAEVAGLIGEMNSAIDKLDPKAIRKAADAAREMAAMLGDAQRARVDSAIEQARKAARTIVKRIEKEGESAATVMLDIQRGAIERARIAFLDLDAPAAVEAAPAVELNRGAALDLDAPAVVEVRDVTPPRGTQLDLSDVATN